MNRLLKLASNVSSVTANKILQRVVEDLVFPWYEAKTGKYSSEKSMRDAIASKLEEQLSEVLWVTRAEALEYEDLSDIFEPHMFAIQQVFQQANGRGSYDLLVVAYERDSPGNLHKLTLSEFLRDFYPYSEFILTDLNS